MAACLMWQVRDVLRFYHFAYNTDKSCVSRFLQYIRFQNKKHPKQISSVFLFLPLRVLRGQSPASLNHLIKIKDRQQYPQYDQQHQHAHGENDQRFHDADDVGDHGDLFTFQLF